MRTEPNVRAAKRRDLYGPGSGTLNSSTTMLGVGVLSLRYAARGLALSRTLRYQQCQPTHRRDALRTFSTTPRRLASEVPDEFIDAIKHTELFKKLADKPQA